MQVSKKLLVLALIVVILFSVISQFKLLLLANIVMYVTIGFVLGYFYRGFRTSRTRSNANRN